MLCGFDDDLAGQIPQTSNRIGGLLTQIHPALERVSATRSRMRSSAWALLTLSIRS